MISLIIGVLSGLICASPFIISKMPSAKEYLDKLAPYAGWIGVCVLGWGVWELISAILGMSYISVNFVGWLLWLFCGIFDLLAGLLLGSGLVLKWTMGGDPAKAAMITEKLSKLAPYQLLIGIGQIVMSLLFFVLW